ncbi:restriction endonuclease [Streptomyces sp. JV185]|uniref:restriction endonuclease n=1 Tax=Streptomyces sp. JV185 TaxID=858638 RepID=UPI002E7907C7|nr:restriction endonuclease [Streptomyces sp. JV185]MEE1768355.1 restriction endonuclease [Streptomyces sp. JV185]MEE1768396.1 restriction endonuclease [Streptomyces sp. JV185]
MTRPRTRGRGRRQRANDRLVGSLAAAVLAVALVVAVVNWLLVHWWFLIAIGVLAVLAGGVLFHQKQQRARWEAVRTQGLRYGLTQLDNLHHTRFEDAVRELMHRDGCQDAARVGGAGDLGADVKATDPYGRRWVIQCKHRRNGLAGSAVGTPDLQVLNGTARQVHGADVAVIVTNGRVTAPAVTFAKQQRLHVVDRHTLGVWAAGSRPLWELLRAVPPPRKPTSLS